MSEGTMGQNTLDADLEADAASVGEQPPSEQAQAPTDAGGRRRSWWHLNYLGLVAACISLVLTTRPSLLPRPPMFEGILTGLGAAVGYGMGVLVSWLLRHAEVPEPPRKLKRVAWLLLAVLGPVAFASAVFLGEKAQNTVRRLVEVPTTSGSYLTTAGLALAVFLGVIVVGKLLRLVNRGVAWLLGRILPRPLARLLSIGLIAGLAYALITGAGFGYFRSWADNTYAPQNDGSMDAAKKPTVNTRSGGPESLSSWESLGYWGRAFVGRGADAAEISKLTGRPAKEPIRVYVGLETAPTAKERAELALKELERTKAFDRKVLVVAAPTGMGWVDPQSIDPVEFMWDGDTAIASIQYSYLPSWISFLVDKERAAEAGRALFETIYEHWSDLPEDKRPKLIAYGLSLGSYAIQSAFGSAQDIAARTDGAILFGTPNFAEPWKTIVAERDKGTPQWQPVYNAGTDVRFAAGKGDLQKPDGEWESPRIVFMQHASDPIVWWNFDLILEEPDWLRERRGPDVSGSTRWYPLVTFLQVTVDQFFASSVPIGHGHNYGNSTVYAWENVLPPRDWTPAMSDQLQARISAYPLE